MIGLRVKKINIGLFVSTIFNNVLLIWHIQVSVFCVHSEGLGFQVASQ